MSRYPDALWLPGLSFKVNGSPNACFGAICHSMEGSFDAAMGELDNPERRASWHFSVRKDGTVYQHYEVEAQCWHGGSWGPNLPSIANRELIGIEHEGKAGEPLTEAQVRASVALCRWLRDRCNWGTLEGRLFEHNQFSSTQCPSGRIPWARYTEADPPRNAEFVIPEEPEVRTRALNTGESIAALNAMAKAHGEAIGDRNGQTILEVIEGAPFPAPPGTRWYLATGKV